MNNKYIRTNWCAQRQNTVEFIISNGINNLIEDSKFGVVYCEENKNKIISSNDWANSSIVPDFIKRTIKEMSLANNNCSVVYEVSNEYYDKVYEKFSELGKVISLHIIIKSTIQHTHFFDDKIYNFCNEIEVLSGEIIVNINMFEEINVIKRELCLLNKDNIGKHILEEVDFVVNEYKDKIKLEKVVINRGIYDIILPAGRGGILIHETIGHNLEADHFFDDKNCLKGTFGKKLFDTSISISDSCCDTDMLSYKYSSDGTLVKSVDMIKNGTIYGILADECSSEKWSIPDTGNGRALSYEYSIIPRMRNTFLHNGNCKKDNIFSETCDGIYALEIGGGRTNIQTGEFVFNISRGCLVKKGEIIGITNPFLFKGKIIDTLNRIDMIADDLRFQFGYCGKQEQLLPVSYGQPTIRVSNYNFGD